MYNPLSLNITEWSDFYFLPFLVHSICTIEEAGKIKLMVETMNQKK